jgi:hypothetical protein
MAKYLNDQSVELGKKIANASTQQDSITFINTYKNMMDYQKKPDLAPVQTPRRERNKTKYNIDNRLLAVDSDKTGDTHWLQNCKNASCAVLSKDCVTENVYNYEMQRNFFLK